MGLSILNLVVRLLRDGNFVADTAYPGQKYPYLAESVAAVHLEKVDRANRTVTVEVNIICPAELGGGKCENEALRATEVLRQGGAACVQSGCKYDGVAQVYTVAVLATFTAVTEEDDCDIGPGFAVRISDVDCPYTVGFTATRTAEYETLYEIGEAAPVALCTGKWAWKLELEEQIPFGASDLDEPQDPFTVQLRMDGRTECYSGCRWLSVKREVGKTGLRKTSVGVAMTMEVE